MQHDMNIGAAIADVYHVVWCYLQLALQLIKHCYFSITSDGPYDALDFTVGFIFEFRSEDVIRRHDPFERRADYFNRRRGEYVRIKMMAVDCSQRFEEQFNVVLEPDPL